MTICCLYYCSSSETRWEEETIDGGLRDIPLQAVVGAWYVSIPPAKSRKKSGFAEIWELLNLGSEGREGV